MIRGSGGWKPAEGLGRSARSCLSSTAIGKPRAAERRLIGYYNSQIEQNLEELTDLAYMLSTKLSLDGISPMAIPAVHHVAMNNQAPWLTERHHQSTKRLVMMPWNGFGGGGSSHTCR